MIAELLTPILERCEEILTDNDYLTELGQNVVYWQPVSFEYATTGIYFRDVSCAKEDSNNRVKNTVLVKLDAVSPVELGDELSVSSDMVKDLTVAFAIDNRLTDEFSVTHRIIRIDKKIPFQGKRLVVITLTIELIYFD